MTHVVLTYEPTPPSSVVSPGREGYRVKPILKSPYSASRAHRKRLSWVDRGTTSPLCATLYSPNLHYSTPEQKARGIHKPNYSDASLSPEDEGMNPANAEECVVS